MFKDIVTHVFQDVLANIRNMINPVTHAQSNDQQCHNKRSTDQKQLHFILVRNS